MSIVNWVKTPSRAPKSRLLDGHEVGEITGSLRSPDDDVSSAVQLEGNAGKCFYGPIPAGKGFILERAQAQAFLSRSDAKYRDVIRPYLGGDDISNDPEQAPTRFIIDFGLRTLEEAREYPEALNVVRLLVKPERDRTRRKAYRERWWRFAEPLVAMRRATAGQSRYIGGTATGKRIFFCWVDAWTCPSNAMNVFAFDDDLAMGVLSSAIHREWARAQSSTLRVDIRYTPKTAFGTFPWPTGETTLVPDAAQHLIARRSEICLERQIGLTKLYNEVDDGAYRDLRELHDALDEAVAAAYGWPASAAHDPQESNRLLLELNRAIAAGEIDYRPFG